MELALTARTFSAAEARAMGLVTEVCENMEALDARAMQLAGLIACKSPLAVTGTKRVLQHARCFPPPCCCPEVHALCIALWLKMLEQCTNTLADCDGDTPLLVGRDRPVQEGLEYVATWNSSQALSHDLREVMAARQQRRRPHSFSKL